jgi:uncharacterized protein
VQQGGEQHDQLVAWLTARAPSVPVTTVETHISILAFQGDRVYKLKKAVRFAFIDLSTAERRLADCEREVALNCRLAPDVYLGVDAVTDREGRVIDHVVVMRRMPRDRRLSSVAGRAEGLACIGALAELMARFHERAPTGGAIDASATRDALAGLWERGLAELPGHSPDIARLVRSYVAGRAVLFQARIAAHRARDGHGDLLADDVFCLPDGPRVLDCMEFDERLRYGDVLADVAFLAMDLELLGRPDLANDFLNAYGAAAHDDWPASLAHFYIAYRAHVRAKVAALRGDDDGVRRRLSLALDHLERGEIRLVLVAGPPATGKTTVARTIADATGWPVLHSDEVRKELAAIPAVNEAGAALDHGIYGSEWTERTYTALCERAREFLANGQSVIVDATWSDRRWRALASSVAQESTSRLIAMRCSAPVAVATERAARRSPRDAGSSDADATITAAVAARFTPWPDARVLDTRDGAAEVAHAALSTVGKC